MANYLKMLKRQQVLALLDLGWTYRRIEAETGVRRETISRYDRLRRGKPAKVFPGSGVSDPPPEHGSAAPGSPNAAKVFPGSEANPAKVFAGSDLPPRSAAALYRDAIEEKLGKGLTVQRVWQDLVEEYGYGYSYESVKRYARRVLPEKKAVGVFLCLPKIPSRPGSSCHPLVVVMKAAQFRKLDHGPSEERGRVFESDR